MAIRSRIEPPPLVDSTGGSTMIVRSIFTTAPFKKSVVSFFAGLSGEGFLSQWLKE